MKDYNSSIPWSMEKKGLCNITDLWRHCITDDNDDDSDDYDVWESESESESNSHSDSDSDSDS